MNILHIYGDSKSIIKGILGHTNYAPSHLSGWIERIKLLIHSLEGTTLQHIYCEENMVANALSKYGLNNTIGIMKYMYIIDNITRDEGLSNIISSSFL